MANAFDTAAADINTQRQAANAAIAAGGSAGAQAFAQGQQQVEAARTAALNQALSEAAQRGQGDIGGVLTGIVNRPYQQLGAGLASSAASHAADAAFMGARANDYFSQLGAAVPMAQAGLEAKIAAAKAKAAANMSDSELRTRLLGAGELTRNQDIADASTTNDALQKQVDQSTKGIRGIDKQLNAWRAGKHGAGNVDTLQAMKDQLEVQLTNARTSQAAIDGSIRNRTDHPVEEYARQAGIDSGQDPYRVAGLIKMPKAKSATGVAALPDAARAVGLSGGRLGKVMKLTTSDGNPVVGTLQSAAQAALKSGESYDTFSKNLSVWQPGRYGRAKALVLAMYRSAFGQ